MKILFFPKANFMFKFNNYTKFENYLTKCAWLWDLRIGWWIIYQENVKWEIKKQNKMKLIRPKGRSQITYQHKVNRIRKWYEHIKKEKIKPIQINPNTKQEPKRKELKPLEWYIEKIKKPNINK